MKFEEKWESEERPERRLGNVVLEEVNTSYKRTEFISISVSRRKAYLVQGHEKRRPQTR